MTTAEYAVGIMAACTFALVLLGVVKSDAVRSALAGSSRARWGSRGEAATRSALTGATSAGW